MALCGKCGTSEIKVPNNSDGNCGKCQSDAWIEWEDFFEIPGTIRGSFTKAYWREAIKWTHSSSMINLMAKTLYSEKDSYSLYDGIKWIFQNDIAPNVLELMKNKQG